MTSIKRAVRDDAQTIVTIGYTAVGDAHRDSAAEADLKDYLDRNYNVDAISKELSDPNNFYFIISYNGQPVGFSKIVMNASHPNIAVENAAKLDRIYVLKEYFGLKLGFELLHYNIEQAKVHNQSGIWLFTWVGNTRAINFYLKIGFKIIGSHHFQVSDTHYNLNHHMLLELT